MESLSLCRHLKEPTMPYGPTMPYLRLGKAGRRVVEAAQVSGLGCCDNVRMLR